MTTTNRPHSRIGLAIGLAIGLVHPAHAQEARQPAPAVQALMQKHYAGYGAKGDPAGTFAQTTAAAWSNCSANGTKCQNRDELVAALSNGLHKLIPDLQWEIVDMMASGDRVIVRGQGSGTPVGPFFGVPPSGKSFRVMSIDIHTLKDGKIVHTHHLEDWVAAQGQLTGR